MKPAFSSALYYPYIDIIDLDWLKTAVLFWDSISTIVPESVVEPYEQNDTKYLESTGFLKPIRVNSNDKSVTDINADVMGLLSTLELDNFFASSNKEYYSIHSDKLSKKLKVLLKRFQGYELFADDAFYMLRDQSRFFGHHNTCKLFDYYLEPHFASLYMMILANRICEQYSFYTDYR